MALITSVDKELARIQGEPVYVDGKPFWFNTIKLLKRGITCGKLLESGSEKPEFYQYDLKLEDIPYYRISQNSASVQLTRESRDALVKALQAIDFDEKP